MFARRRHRAEHDRGEGVVVLQISKQGAWVRSWARERSHDPVFWTDVIQVVKTVVAAVVAWILAADVLGLPQPFLAPWAALLVVHATVYRTFSRGAQQVAATVVGVVFAWGTGNLLGLDHIALTMMLLAASTIGHITFLREATTIKMGVLLCDMAAALRNDPGDEELHSWVARTEDADNDIDHAGALVRQARESGRFNPRRRAGDVRKEGEFGDVLNRLEQSVADIRSMVRTIEHSVTNVLEWDPRFRQSWVDLVEETGLAIGDADSARLSEVRRRLRRLADDLSTEDSLACTGRSTAVSSRICATSSTRWMSWQTKTRSPRRVHNRAPRPEFEGPPPLISEMVVLDPQGTA